MPNEMEEPQELPHLTLERSKLTQIAFVFPTQQAEKYCFLWTDRDVR